MVVVLPAPLGPMNPKISPCWTWKLRVVHRCHGFSQGALINLGEPLNIYGFCHAHTPMNLGIRNLELGTWDRGIRVRGSLSS